jgi:hypothetical protein
MRSKALTRPLASISVTSYFIKPIRFQGLGELGNDRLGRKRRPYLANTVEDTPVILTVGYSQGKGV